MSTHRQRDITLVPFPFSDLSGQKVRPVLILSNDTYNEQSSDVLVCPLTTNLTPMPYAVEIDITDVEEPGTLRHRSKVKADTVASLDKSILLKQIARLKVSVFRKVAEEIENLINFP